MDGSTAAKEQNNRFPPLSELNIKIILGLSHTTCSPVNCPLHWNGFKSFGGFLVDERDALKQSEPIEASWFVKKHN